MARTLKLPYRYAHARRAGALIQRDPRYAIATSITEALDPGRAPGKVRTLADMTPEEREEMAKLYGKAGSRKDDE